MSKIVAVVLLLLEACDALLVTPHSSHALLRTDGRCSAPLLLTLDLSRNEPPAELGAQGWG